MEAIARELRYAVRTLVASPGFTAVSLLTLALGIGATTAIYTVVKGVLLTPLPYPEPDRLMMLSESNPEAGFPVFSVSPFNFLDYQEGSETFEALAAFRSASPNLSEPGGEPQRLVSLQVTSGYFRVLGLELELGRGFSPEEDQLGAEPVVVLGYALWQGRFGGDRDVLGRGVHLDGVPHTVVGVAPAGLPGRTDVFRPLAVSYERYGRGSRVLNVVGRLADGVTEEQAATEMGALAARLAEAYPRTNAGWTVLVQPWKERLVGRVSSTLWMLFAAVGAVLAIGCSNLANLLLARLAGRERSLAVRTALGASRGRLVREALAESGVLALSGGVVGVLASVWGTDVLVRMAGPGLPRVGGPIEIDLGVLGFASAVSCLTALAFGLVPALHASRIDPREALKEGGHGGLGGGRGRTLRAGLVTLEVALALALLVCAGLLLRSFERLQEVDLGFEPEGVLTARLSLPQSGGRYDTPEEKLAFYRQLEERMAAIPGVESAGMIYPLPIGGGPWILDVFLFGRPIPAGDGLLNSHVRYVTPGYFETLGIRLRQGRLFTEADSLASERVVILNTTAVKQFFPEQEPLGERLAFKNPTEEAEPEWFRVVGVVDDVRHLQLDSEPGAEIYRSARQRPRFDTALVLRTSGPPENLVQPLRQAVTAVDPTLPIYGVFPMEKLIEASLQRTSFRTVLLGLFAALALVLAAVGIYGVVAYSVSRSLREIGLRLALGGRRGSVLALVVRRGMTPVVAGAGLGLVAAFVAVRWVEGLLFGVGPRDPLVFLVVSAVLVGVALLACLVPAWRSMRVDPAVVLREE